MFWIAQASETSLLSSSKVTQQGELQVFYDSQRELEVSEWKKTFSLTAKIIEENIQRKATTKCVLIRLS